jgi:hypothetical protein
MSTQAAIGKTKVTTGLVEVNSNFLKISTSVHFN